VFATWDDQIDELPLSSQISLYTKFDIFNFNGFLPELPPKSCQLQNGERQGPLEIGKLSGVTVSCTRRAEVSDVIARSLRGKFSILGEDGDFIDHVYVENDYDVDCDFEVTEVMDCLPRSYGAISASSAKHEFLFGEFTDYNYCDNPKNQEFKSQVFDKWTNYSER
jgi:hypothetical protein